MPSTSSNRFDASYAESLKGLFCLLLVLGVWFLHFGVSINVFLFFFVEKLQRIGLIMVRLSIGVVFVAPSSRFCDLHLF